jgi:hypothetical protein
MGDVLRIDQVIGRRIDEEIVKARAKFGRYDFDLQTLEGSRGSTDNRGLLRALCQLNGVGARSRDRERGGASVPEVRSSFSLAGAGVTSGSESQSAEEV